MYHIYIYLNINSNRYYFISSIFVGGFESTAAASALLLLSSSRSTQLPWTLFLPLSLPPLSSPLLSLPFSTIAYSPLLIVRSPSPAHVPAYDVIFRLAVRPIRLNAPRPRLSTFMTIFLKAMRADL